MNSTFSIILGLIDYNVFKKHTNKTIETRNVLIRGQLCFRIAPLQKGEAFLAGFAP